MIPTTTPSVPQSTSGKTKSSSTPKHRFVQVLRLILNATQGSNLKNVHRTSLQGIGKIIAMILTKHCIDFVNTKR